MKSYRQKLDVPEVPRQPLVELAQMVEAAYTHDLAEVRRMTNVAGLGPVIEFRWGEGIEDSFWVKVTTNDQGRGEALVINSGTESGWTLFDQIAGRGQDPIFPGFIVIRAMRAFLNRARVIVAKTEELLVQLDTIFGVDNWDLLVVGHSLGAAEMLVASFLLTSAIIPPARLLPRRITLVTFGCPRAFDPFAARNWECKHLRVHNALDVVTHIPPTVFILGPGVLEPIPNPVLAFFLGIPGIILTVFSTTYFEHHGTPLLLLSTGEGFTDDSDPEFVNLALLDIPNSETNVGRILATHGIREYIRRLLLGLPEIIPPREDRLPPFFEAGPFTQNLGTFFFGSTHVAEYLSQMAITLPGGQGGTESYYQTAGSEAEAMDNLKWLSERRQSCLNSSSQIKLLRVSDVRIQGDSKLMEVSPFPVTFPADGFYAHLFVRLTGAPAPSTDARYKRPLFLMGVPDDVIQNGLYGQTNLPLWMDRLNYFLNSLISKPPNLRVWKMKVIEKPDAPHAKIATIVIDTVAPNVGKLLVTTVAPHGISTTEPSVVKLAKVRWSGPELAPNGPMNVIGTSATSFRIHSRVGAKTELFYVLGASLGAQAEVWRRNYIYVAIKQADVIRAASRRRGRPFGLLAGRARARKA